MVGNSTNPIPNTGIVQLQLPTAMPATCALEFQLTSKSKDTNRGYTRNIIVRASVQGRRGRSANAQIVAWSPGAWEECNAMCGGGKRTRNATCVDLFGNVVADTGQCGKAGSIAMEESCNTHACLVAELRLVSVTPTDRLGYDSEATHEACDGRKGDDCRVAQGCFWDPETNVCFAQRFRANASTIAAESISRGGVWLAGDDYNNTLIASWIGGLPETPAVTFQLRQTPTNGWFDVPSSIIDEGTAVIDVNGIALPSGVAYQLKISMETDFGELADETHAFSICPNADALGRCTEGVDHCASNPCSPDGSSRCSATEDGSGFSCTCREGFEGPICDQDVAKKAKCPANSAKSSEFDGLCQCTHGAACSITQNNQGCAAMYNAESNPASWVWLFSEKCETCRCDRTISDRQSEECKEKRCGDAMQCINGACECNFGYQRVSNSDVDAGCIWSIQFKQVDAAQEWRRGENVNISWSAFGTATVRIDLLQQHNSDSGHTVAASVTRQTPNVGVFEWTVPTTLAVSNGRVEYVVQISANHDYRVSAKSAVSIVYGESESLPGPMISPAKYSTVRAVGQKGRRFGTRTSTDDELYAVRVQWHPPAVVDDQRRAGTLVMIQDQRGVGVVQEVVVADEVDLLAGSMAPATLPVIPDVFVPTPVRLVFRDGDGDIVQQSFGPVFLLEPPLPTIAIEALAVREDQRKNQIHFAVNWISTGIRNSEGVILQMMDGKGEVLHEAEIVNVGEADFALDLDAVEDAWAQLVVRSSTHSEAWDAIQKGEHTASTTTNVAAIVVPIVLVLLVGLGIGFIVVRNKKRRETKAKANLLEVITTVTTAANVDKFVENTFNRIVNRAKTTVNETKREEDPSKLLNVVTAAANVDKFVENSFNRISETNFNNIVSRSVAASVEKEENFDGFGTDSEPEVESSQLDYEAQAAREAAQARLAALRARPPPRRLADVDRAMLFASFAAMDTDGSSKLSKEEFQAGLRDTKVYGILESYQIDIDELSYILDEDDSGSISVMEFINGIVEIVGEHADRGDAAIASAVAAAAAAPTHARNLPVAASVGWSDSDSYDSDSYDSDDSDVEI